MRKDLDDNELIRMQQEAVRRVQEMQKKARLSFEESRPKVPMSQPSRQERAVETVPELPVRDTGVLPLLIGLLGSGKRDPVLAAVLTYLNT